MGDSIEASQKGWALDRIPSRTITSLTGARGRLLHELCLSLGVGETKQGTERHFDALEAALLTLVARLSAQGLRRSEAVAIALEAKEALARFLRNPDGPQRWLWATRLDDADQWTTLVLDDSGSPEVDDSAGDRASGYIVVNLRTIVRAVLAAGGARQ